MRINNSGSRDVRRIFSGKDAAVYSEDGELLATITQFQAQINVTNGTYNPLGSAITMKHLLSYEVTLSASETVIETGRFIKEMYDWLMNGYPIDWTVRSQIIGWSGSVESIVWRQCVPDGQINLQNMNVGELWVRDWSLHCNAPPELQKILSAGYWRD